MGQAIVYCSNCSAQLRSSDFDARKAFKVDDLNFCLKCYREVVGEEPPPAAMPSKSGATSRITIAPPPPPAAPKPAGTPYGIIAAAGIGLIAVVIAIVAMSGNSERRPPPPPPIVAAPAPEQPRMSARETAAQEALAKALRTEESAARRALLVEAVARAEGTALHADARRELEKVERKLKELEKPETAKVPVPPPPSPSPEPKPAPPPPPPDHSREEAAARAAQWEAALSPATGRDYAAAIAALPAADLPLLKSVSTLHQEALLALTRTPKGQKVAIEHRDASGAPRKSEGLFVEEDNGRVELRSETGSSEIEVGEILPAWLAEQLRSRGSAVDPVAAALFCLLEGDEPGARRLAGDKAATIPERYWTYARSIAPDPARALYHEALGLANGFATAADAVPKYQALLRDHAGSPFVRRNKTSIAARAQQCARDFLFVAADLKPSGGFKAAKTAKGSVCWTSEADSKDAFIDFSCSVLADTAYRCWIYAGGCCQETFEFSVQGTEMKSGREKEPVEPGSAAAAVVKPYLSSLKKTHAGHTGPKQPSHWEWVSIPLPKYAKPGLQQVRVLTNQKGFSVAFACVTSTRTAAPRELELRELEKIRGTVPIAPPGPRATVLYAPAFDGTDRHLLGEVRDKALYGVLSFGMSFAGYQAGQPAFIVPAQGELRMTYYLKTASPLQVRFRVVRGEGKSDAYDVHVAQPVAGRPVDVRFPISEFKPMLGGAQPPLAVGDPVPMIYVMAQDPNCGLRLDALSVVELKAESTVATKPAFSENFDAGPGRFNGGEWVAGGIKGTKALSVPPTGIDLFGAWSVPVKDSTTISFKLKPLGDLSRVDVLVWSEALRDNGRYFIEGLKKGEWTEVRFKASELRIGNAREGRGIDVLSNFKLFIQGSPLDCRILMDDFEIRE